MASARSWAKKTFGDAQLGDERRTSRLIEVVAGVASRPGGRLTQVFKDPAQREAAFRLIENDAVEAREVALASHRATARACSDKDLVYVPVDQTGLSLVDRQGTKFGRVGSNGTRRRGILAMSGLAVDLQGTTLGTLALECWVRSDEPCPRWKQDKRPAEERESHLWRRALDSTVAVMSEHAPKCKPWFQLDRGGDFGDVLSLAYEQNLLVTVRANHNRALGGRHQKQLWGCMKTQPVLGQMTVAVPAREGKPARIARLSVRAKKIPFLVASATQQRRSRPVELTAVYVTEPKGPKGGIEWMLWTTYPAKTAADALHVVKAYTMRWRIEDFHRAWKSSHCDIESSQLRSVDALQRWGAITAAVAARAEHLKLRSRSEPDVLAETELSRLEIDAAIILSETKKYRRGDPLTLHQAVDLIARLGGYTGKSSGGPPGTITISRGLDYLSGAVKLMEALRSG